MAEKRRRLALIQPTRSTMLMRQQRPLVGRIKLTSGMSSLRLYLRGNRAALQLKVKLPSRSHDLSISVAAALACFSKAFFDCTQNRAPLVFLALGDADAFTMQWVHFKSVQPVSCPYRCLRNWAISLTVFCSSKTGQGQTGQTTPLRLFEQTF